MTNNNELIPMNVFISRMRVLMTMYTMHYQVGQIEIGQADFPTLLTFPGWIDNFAEFLEFQADNEKFMDGVYKSADELLMSRENESEADEDSSKEVVESE